MSFLNAILDNEDEKLIAQKKSELKIDIKKIKFEDIFFMFCSKLEIFHEIVETLSTSVTKRNNLVV